MEEPKEPEEPEQSHQVNELKTKICYDDIVQEVCRTFTLQTPEFYEFTKHEKPEVKDFQIGVIVGASGSGKSLLLKEFGTEEVPTWNNKAICSAFIDYQDAEDRLLGAGLSSIPTWLAPYSILSTGQKYRADVARKLKSGALFDEFTSVIDRNTACSLANSIRLYAKRNNLKDVVIATPHHDILEYLQPDWVYETDTRELVINGEFEDKIDLGIDVITFTK